MKSYGIETYGEKIAPVYDGWYAEADPAMIDVLAELAGSGRALELGIGTGRVALPLAERGVKVYGIDASEAMVARLRQRTGGAEIPVTPGDFAEVSVEGRFSLVYVVFNTFFALLTQEAQVRCFRNAAARLEEGGVFVLETFFPDVSRFVRGQNASVNRVDDGTAVLDLTRHDPVAQTTTSQHVVLAEEGVRLFPVRVRYAWPSEMDLMGRLAGLRLRERWGGWDRQAFRGGEKHVSVYEQEPGVQST